MMKNQPWKINKDNGSDKYECLQGSINDEKLQILTDRGYKVVNWSFDSEDSLGATANQSKASYDKLAKEFPKPQISLNHEPVQTTADDVAPYAINLLQNAGYKLISLPECLGFGTSTESFYQSVGKPSTRDVSELITYLFLWDFSIDLTICWILATFFSLQTNPELMELCRYTKVLVWFSFW